MFVRFGSHTLLVSSVAEQLQRVGLAKSRFSEPGLCDWVESMILSWLGESAHVSNGEIRTTVTKMKGLEYVK